MYKRASNTSENTQYEKQNKNSPCQLTALRNRPFAYQFYMQFFHNAQSPGNRPSEYPMKVDKTRQDFMMFSVSNLVQ